MTQTATTLPGFVLQADRRVRDAVLAVLLAERMSEQPGEPLDVPGVGTVVPFRPSGGAPPHLSPEQEAEFARRFADRHNARPLSEYIRKL